MAESPWAAAQRPPAQAFVEAAFEEEELELDFTIGDETHKVLAFFRWLGRETRTTLEQDLDVP
eukprot:129699-Lingulodinium_polyedra.AAC.1